MASEEKVAIITAAGRGMGAAIAKELAGRGYKVALMSPTERAEELAAELGGFGMRGSNAERPDLETLVEKTMETYGRIDALVNHTGGPPKGELLEITDQDWRYSLDLVLLHVIRLCRLVTPVMQKQNKGAIVNITTFSAFEPELKFPVSSVLRAGIGSFTKLYADRYAKDNIRMNCLLPGYIDSLDHTEETRAKVPLGRIGSVEEIAKTTAFLLSDDAGYITGQNLRVDGGITRHV